MGIIRDDLPFALIPFIHFDCGVLGSVPILPVVSLQIAINQLQLWASVYALPNPKDGLVNWMKYLYLNIK